MWVMPDFTRFLRRLYRTESERKELALPHSRRLRMGGWLLMLLALVWVVYRFLYPFPRAWITQQGPDIAIPSQSWVALYSEPRTESDWMRAIPRDNEAHKAKRKDPSQTSIWLRTLINLPTLHAASQLEARFLALGWLRGKARITLNGSLYFESARATSFPIVIPLDEQVMSRPISLEIRVDKTPTHQFPDLLNLGQDCGFYTSAQLDTYIGRHSFWARIRPVTYLLLNLAVALFFFGVWIHFPNKPEHYHLALFGLANAFAQVRQVDLVFLNVDYLNIHQAGFLTKTWVGITGLLFAFSLARIRTSWTRPVAWSGALLPFVALALFWSPERATTFEATAGAVLIPLCLVIGALACLSQWAYLLQSFGSAIVAQQRIRTLALSSVGMIAMASLYGSSVQLDSNSLKSEYGFFSHMAAHVGIVVYWAFVLLQEMRQQSLLVERIPVSEYHRMSELPPRLKGAVLTIDMKNSEALFRMSSDDSEGVNWVGLWRSHAYLIFSEYDGTVLQKKGDEVQIFFDGEKHESPELAAFRAFCALVAASRRLETSLASADLTLLGSLRFRLRGSLVAGAVRPIWEEMGRGRKEPYWEQVSGSNTFVDAARLLESEKILVQDKLTDALTMLAPLAQVLAAHREPGTWISGVSLRIKNSPLYNISAFIPLADDQARRVTLNSHSARS